MTHHLQHLREGLTPKLLAYSAAGYSGVIYPDPHDWECNGHEVALWDPDAALFPGEIEEAA